MLFFWQDLKSLKQYSYGDAIAFALDKESAIEAIVYLYYDYYSYLYYDDEEYFIEKVNELRLELENTEPLVYSGQDIFGMFFEGSE